MQLDSRSTLTIIQFIKAIRMSLTKPLDCLFQQWKYMYRSLKMTDICEYKKPRFLFKFNINCSNVIV